MSFTLSSWRSTRFGGALAVSFLLGLAPSAWAADSADIEDLKKRVAELEKKSGGCGFHPKKRLGIRCRDWEGHIFGRIQYDVLLLDEDKKAYETTAGFQSEGLKGSGSGLRRARIGVGGKFFRHWTYKFEYDASSSSPIKDAYVGYADASVYGKLGNAKAPFSLEEMTSSRFTTFIERARTDKNPVIPGRVLGAFFGYGAKRWSVHGALLGDKYTSKGSGSWGLAGRVTAAPLYEKGVIYSHIGLSVHWRKSGACKGAPQDKGTCHDWGKLRDRSPYTSAVLDGYPFAVEFDDWRQLTVMNPEAAFGWGPFGIQGEYLFADLDYRGAAKTPSFKAWYLQANWWLTGEHNRYAPSKGAFGRVVPLARVSQGGMGAIGLAIRYQAANFASRTYPISDKRTGGAARAWTFNATFKPNAYVKFMGEYVRGWRSYKACDGVCRSHETPNAFQFRAQVDF